MAQDTKPVHGGGPQVAPDPGRRLVDGVWRDDVTLEMWIDTRPTVVAIRLAGVLDGATGANVARVVEDCMAEGQREFVLDVTHLQIEAGGGAVLHDVGALVHAAGGRCRVDPVTMF